MPDTRYVVQTPDGEMTYGSIDQLRQAVEFGLVSPDDLVTEEGHKNARPAKLVLHTGASAPAVKSATWAPGTAPGRALWSYLVIGAIVLGLLYLELPRLTIIVPGLMNIPGVTAIFPRANPGGALPVPAWLPEAIAPPADAGWAHVVVGALLLGLVVRGLWAAGPQTAAFLLAAAGYLFATGRLAVPIILVVAAAGVIARAVIRWRRARA